MWTFGFKSEGRTARAEGASRICPRERRPLSSLSDKTALRRQLRARRRALTEAERFQRSRAVCRRIAQRTEFRRARRIALYLAADGEVDLAPLLDKIWARRQMACLPVLRPLSGRKMDFLPYEPGDLLNANRYGIPEPVGHPREAVAPPFLDLVLLPLVAFDLQGNRLGMGGGFYDRTFAFLRRRHRWHRPRLVGVAYDFQQVEYLPAEPWDVPLHAVVTESRWIPFPLGGSCP